MNNINSPLYEPVLSAFLDANIDESHEAILFGDRGSHNRRIEYESDVASAMDELYKDSKLTIVAFSTVNRAFRSFVALKSLYETSRFVASSEDLEEPYVGESADVGRTSARTIVVPRSIGRGAILLDALSYLNGAEGINEFGSNQPSGRVGPHQVIGLDLVRTTTSSIKEEILNPST